MSENPKALAGSLWPDTPIVRLFGEWMRLDAAEVALGGEGDLADDDPRFDDINNRKIGIELQMRSAPKSCLLDAILTATCASELGMFGSAEWEDDRAEIRQRWAATSCEAA